MGKELCSSILDKRAAFIVIVTLIWYRWLGLQGNLYNLVEELKSTLI
jgi:hypothetical protein